MLCHAVSKNIRKTVGFHLPVLWACVGLCGQRCCLAFFPPQCCFVLNKCNFRVIVTAAQLG